MAGQKPTKASANLWSRRNILFTTLSSIFMLLFVGAGATSLILLSQNQTLAVIFSIFSLAGLVLFGIMISLFFVNQRRMRLETESAVLAFSEQLDALDSSRVRLTSNDYYNPALTQLQRRLNALVARVAQKNQKTEEERHIVTGKIYTEKEFPLALRDCISSSTSFRSALLTIKADGAKSTPDSVDDTLLRTIKLFFTPTILCKKENGLYQIYLENIGSNETFKSRCENFIRAFSVTEIEQETDNVIFYFARLGAAIFPFVSDNGLIQVSEAALKKASPLYIDCGGDNIALPRATMADKPKRVMMLSANEMFLKRFREATSETEVMDVVSELIEFYCNTMDYDCGGVLLYNDYSDEYSLLLENETSQKEGGLSLFATDRIIPGKYINPLFEYVSKEGFTFIDDVNLIPYEIAEKMQSIGASSILVCPVIYDNRRHGVAYLLSSKQKKNQDLPERENVSLFFSLISVMIVTLNHRRKTAYLWSLLNTFASHENKEIYTIETSSYKLMSFSESISKNFPDAQVGLPCYKALMGKDEPCEDCPLRKGTLKRVLAPLGPAEHIMSVLSTNKTSTGSASSILIESEQQTNAASSNLYDKSLGIYNAKAFSNDINREIRTRGTGSVFSVRITNIDEIRNRYKEETTESIMQAVSRLIQDAGYGNLVYRYDANTLSFLLKSTTKTALLVFVEEIASLLKDPIELAGNAIELKTAYSTISYPSEASTNFEMVSLVGSELQRSTAMGPGFLCEVGRNHVRKADREQYLLQLVEESLAKNQTQVLLSSITETASQKTNGIEFCLGLKGYAHEEISNKEFLPIANKYGLIARLDFAGLGRIQDFYKNYNDTTLKPAGVKKIAYMISVSTALNNNYLPQIQKFMSAINAPRGTVTICLDCRQMAGHEEDIKKVISMTRPLGLEYCAYSYDPNVDNADKIKEMGFVYVRIARKVLQSAMSSQSVNALFIRMAAEFDEKDIIPVVNRVTDQDQVQFCLDLAMPFYVDGGKACKLSDQEFVTYLNFKR